MTEISSLCFRLCPYLRVLCVHVCYANYRKTMRDTNSVKIHGHLNGKLYLLNKHVRYLKNKIYLRYFVFAFHYRILKIHRSLASPVFLEMS